MELVRRFILFLLPLFFVIALPGCSKKDAPTDLVTFPLRGQVLGIDSVQRRVTIAHEEIPNYMPAMAMPFKVKNPALLKGLHVGDSVGATLAVSRTESWLETISVIRAGEAVPALSADQVQLVHLFREGEPLPDPVFINQNGQTVRLSNFRGKTIALTFIYTRCPLPDFCIRMSQQFARVQRILKDDRALNGKWHLLSVSFDPAFDRPPVLLSYGRNYGADFSVWEFLTDPDTSGSGIRSFAEGFGLSYEPSEGLINHNLRTAVVDPKGNLVRVLSGNEWEADEVANEVKRETGSDL